MFLEATSKVFEELSQMKFLGSALQSLNKDKCIVALDEANVALHSSLGGYESMKTEGLKRPFLCCIGDALSRSPCVFSGTSYSENELINLIPSSTAVAPTFRVFLPSKMGNVTDVITMMARFGFREQEFRFAIFRTPHWTMSLCCDRYLSTYPASSRRCHEGKHPAHFYNLWKFQSGGQIVNPKKGTFGKFDSCTADTVMGGRSMSRRFTRHVELRIKRACPFS
jgi:hypothetical protein